MSVRVKDWPKTATTSASDDYLGQDGATNGSRRILASSMKADFALAYVGDPATYDLATLDGTGKLTLSQRPTGAESYVQAWDPETNTPALTDAGGSNGEVYRINIVSGAASHARDLGGGSVTWTQNGEAVHNGTKFENIKDAANIFNGSASTSAAATAGNYYETEDVSARTSGAIGRPIVMGGGASSIGFTDLAITEIGDAEDFFFFGEVSFENNPSTNMPIITKRSGGGTGYTLYFDTSGRLRAHLQASGGTVTLTADGESLAGRKIRFVINGDRDGNGTRYVDNADVYGTADALSTASGNFANTAAFTVGHDGTNRFEGKIYSLGMGTGLLSTAQIEEFMETGEIPSATRWGTDTTVVTDGGFENWTGSTLDNWTKGASATISEETTDVQEGSSALDFQGGGNQSSSANTLYTPTNIIDGAKSYRVRFKVKNSSAGTLQFGPGAYYCATWDNTTLSSGLTELQTNFDNAVVYKTLNDSLGSGWSQIEVEFALNRVSSLLDFRFGGTGQWLIDDLVIEPIGVRWTITGESYDSTNNVAPDLSSNGNNGTGASVTKESHPRSLHINAPNPAADEILFSVQGNKFGVDEDGEIRQENLGADVPVAKYGADAITTAGTVSHQIPVDIGGTTYYLVAHTHGS